MSSSDHTVLNGSKGDLVCRPTGWTDVVKFILFNYVIHGATVVIPPGYSRSWSLFMSLSALFMPYYGILMALQSMASMPRLGSNPLQVAHKAGALCMVVPRLRYVDKFFLRVSEYLTIIAVLKRYTPNVILTANTRKAHVL
jgi:hypothetical protein